VRVAVEARRRSVSSPASVSNSGVGIVGLLQVDIGLSNQLLQFLDLSNFLESKNLVLLVTIDS
jgi:hypothetical protein